MRILLVEDELKLANYLHKGLTENGFVVDIANDGETGLQMASTGHYFLIILDVMLPVRDGWSIIKELRANGVTTLAMFLTARDSLNDRIHGWESGADGYLVKPFSFSELLAQIHSLLKRVATRQPEIVKIADLEIDFIHHKITRSGVRLDPTPTEFTLLSLLARRQGEVLSRVVISEQVWNVNFETATNVVDVHIRRLRAKVDDPFKVKLIHTIRGIGYVLKAEE